MSGARPRKGNHSSARAGVAISRRLRNAGIITIAPSTRWAQKGVSVSNSGTGAEIVIDLDPPRHRLEVAEEIERLCDVWGYHTTRDDNESGYVVIYAEKKSAETDKVPQTSTDHPINKRAAQLAYQEALRMAGGDHTRLIRNTDGSVTIN